MGAKPIAKKVLKAKAAKISLKYSQKTDSTLIYFIKKKESFVGQSGMLAQIKGSIPSAAAIRVKAIRKDSRRRFGAGLDEGFPTDQRKYAVGNPRLAGIQSGLRGSTDLTILMAPDGTVGGHTGMFRLNANASSHTAGQAAAHDVRRVTIDKTWSLQKTISITTQNHIRSLAPGPSVIKSKSLVGARPNINTISTIESGVGINLKKLAVHAHESREEVKARLSVYESAYKLKRSSSPERTPLKPDGSGGEHSLKPIRVAPILPQFVGSHEYEIAANISAWISQPLRIIPY